MKISIKKESNTTLPSATWSVEKFRLSIKQSNYCNVSLEVFRYPSNCSAVVLAGLHSMFDYGTKNPNDFPNRATPKRAELRFKKIVKRLFENGVADSKDLMGDGHRIAHNGADVGVSHIQLTVNREEHKNILESAGFTVVNQYKSLSSGGTLYIMTIVNPECSAETSDDGSDDESEITSIF